MNRTTQMTKILILIYQKKASLLSKQGNNTTWIWNSTHITISYNFFPWLTRRGSSESPSWGATHGKCSVLLPITPRVITWNQISSAFDNFFPVFILSVARKHRIRNTRGVPFEKRERKKNRSPMGIVYLADKLSRSLLLWLEQWPFPVMCFSFPPAAIAEAVLLQFLGDSLLRRRHDLYYCLQNHYLYHLVQ